MKFAEVLGEFFQDIAYNAIELILPVLLGLVAIVLFFTAIFGVYVLSAVPTEEWGWFGWLAVIDLCTLGLGFLIWVAFHIGRLLMGDY